MDETKYDKFDDERVKAYEAVVTNNWERFEQIVNTKELLSKPFDLFRNTAIHLVARSGKSQIFRKLLNNMLSETERFDALRWKNGEGSTVLHVADDPNMVEVIMDMADNKYSLLELPNDDFETPAYRAAKYGKLHVLKYLHANYGIEAKHFPLKIYEGLQRPILHYCVLTFNFHTAIWLLQNIGKSLAEEKEKLIPNKNEDEHAEEEGITCLKLLSKMRMAFKSTDTRKLGLTKRFIYELLPEDGYESELEDGAGNSSVKVTRDEESSQLNDGNTKTTKSKVGTVLSRVNKAFWKRAKGYPCVQNVWDLKRTHKFAERLLELLLDSEDSWKQCPYVPPKEKIMFSREFPSNVTEKKDRIKMKDKVMTVKDSLNDKQTKEEWLGNNTSPMWETPLFLAAAFGIIEVVERIVKRYPQAVSYVNSDGLNLLHVVVKHRQMEIYDYIRENPAFESLKQRISKDKRTILHHAASMEYYREEALAGVAYQLQRELQWYHQVREIVPRQYLMHVDKDGLTPGDLLDIDHADMHDQAKNWMKETAQSCSTVAVLIAGVVFAAAYAIPGGTSGGRAVLRSNSAFRIFTIMDVVALATSLGSVVMFLSILTSSFDLWEFHVALPRKLKLGFIMLFFSLITTMLAFAATILLTIRMEGNKKSTTLAYSLAFVIVSVFGMTQFPLYQMIQDGLSKPLWRLSLFPIDVVVAIVSLFALQSPLTHLSKNIKLLGFRMPLLLQKASLTDIKSETELEDNRNEYQGKRNSEKQVREIVPRQYLMHVDKDGLTPGDLLDIDHADMNDQAKNWMKETAQSCSTVAVLIAGVVFAAAYAIPGGTSGGRAVLRSNSAFRIFTIMDVVALATSLGSVVMFLSILTSSFDLWEFHVALPRKLKLGFIMLFFSLITTMLAFAATILLTIRMEGNKKSTTLAYSLAFVIVSVFGMTQFPLYQMIQDGVKKYSRIWKSLQSSKKYC
ncbi:hypothetical protein Fmac_011045 [Flemingia macrophylla]|uniref:PGG domain-containing protein n=1 Tax=Flemingia macrophylla TaxID=520843 RepID=A0ABD1MLA8_9FABA